MRDPPSSWADEEFTKCSEWHRQIVSWARLDDSGAASGAARVVAGLMSLLFVLVISVTTTSGQQTPSVAVAAAAAPAPLLTGTVDATKVVAPSFRAVRWTAPSNGSFKFTMSWTGAGALNMDLRLASDLTFIAKETSAANPKTMTATVQAGVIYQVAVWSTSGVGTFTLNVAAPGVTPTRPNILIIISDDQRRDALLSMPKVQKWFGAGGGHL